jgi:hypothetical protein
MPKTKNSYSFRKSSESDALGNEPPILDKEIDEQMQKQNFSVQKYREKLRESNSCRYFADDSFFPPMMKGMAKHRSYTIEKKLEVVNYAKSHSTYASARHFGIDRKMIASWKKQEQELIARKYVFSFPKIFI